mmetsp:Transcript_22/g.53  ORF Transcript_22/g.53 Transcript_22/m.53 type:complete len:545 (-) Transcript_22:1429-3063(-)
MHLTAVLLVAVVLVHLHPQHVCLGQLATKLFVHESDHVRAGVHGQVGGEPPPLHATQLSQAAQPLHAVHADFAGGIGSRLCKQLWQRRAQLHNVQVHTQLLPHTCGITDAPVVHHATPPPRRLVRRFTLRPLGDGPHRGHAGTACGALHHYHALFGVRQVEAGQKVQGRVGSLRIRKLARRQASEDLHVEVDALNLFKRLPKLHVGEGGEFLLVLVVVVAVWVVKTKALAALGADNCAARAPLGAGRACSPGGAERFGPFRRDAAPARAAACIATSAAAAAAGARHVGGLALSQRAVGCTLGSAACRLERLHACRHRPGRERPWRAPPRGARPRRRRGPRGGQAGGAPQAGLRSVCAPGVAACGQQRVGRLRRRVGRRRQAQSPRVVAAHGVLQSVEEVGVAVVKHKRGARPQLLGGRRPACRRERHRCADDHLECGVDLAVIAGALVPVKGRSPPNRRQWKHVGAAPYARVTLGQVQKRQARHSTHEAILVFFVHVIGSAVARVNSDGERRRLWDGISVVHFNDERILFAPPQHVLQRVVCCQ